MARRSAPKRAVLSLCVALAICTFAAEAFLGGVVNSFRRSPRELRAKAEEKKPPRTPATPLVSSKPKSAPEPVATEAKNESEAKVEPAKESPLDVIKKTRAAMSKELEALASEAGVEASNKTRSDLELRALIEKKVQPLGQASPIRKKLEDLESRLVRTELALIAGDATKEATDFDLVSAAAAKAAELAKANAKIKALEMSLDESNDRAGMLSDGVKEIGKLVGVGGLGGLMQFFMSEEAIIQETKDKVAAKTKSSR